MKRSVSARRRRRSRTAARSRSAGRGRAARGGPARGRSPRRTTGRASVAARMWGTPQRSRRISTGPSSPASRRRPVGPRQRPAKELLPAGPAAVVAASAAERPAERARIASPACRRVMAATLDRRGSESRKPLRQPALGLELLQVGLHHHRRRRAHSAGTSSQAASSRRARERSPASSAATQLALAHRGGARRTRRASPRVGDVGTVAGAEQLEVELPAGARASPCRPRASRRRAGRRSSRAEHQVAAEADRR